MATELKIRLETLLERLEALPEFGYEPCCELQNIFTEFRSYLDKYIKLDMPEVESFENQVNEIQKNIEGLTMDDKGRDLEVYKSNIYHKSIKDMKIFIREYIQHLN